MQWLWFMISWSTSLQNRIMIHCVSFLQGRMTQHFFPPPLSPPQKKKTAPPVTYTWKNECLTGKDAKHRTMAAELLRTGRHRALVVQRILLEEKAIGHWLVLWTFHAFQLFKKKNKLFEITGGSIVAIYHLHSWITTMMTERNPNNVDGNIPDLLTEVVCTKTNTQPNDFQHSKSLKKTKKHISNKSGFSKKTRWNRELLEPSREIDAKICRLRVST